jgi:predicted RNA-binding Zn ribbon-like protein
MSGDSIVSGEHHVAPGRLEIARAFVNTRDLEGGADEIASPELLARWLAERELAPKETAASWDDVAEAHEVREALRGLAWANNGEAVDGAALHTLNRTAEQARLTLRFTSGDDVGLHPGARGVRGALGTIVAIVADSVKDGTWSRFKACRNEQCGWAFYDHARNRSAKWCTMAVCGNRMKARAFRARHAGDAGP